MCMWAESCETCWGGELRMMFRLSGETVGTLTFDGAVCVRSDRERFDGLNGVSNEAEALTTL